jgi:predicted neutral ceramidase superfamily lipid hydrolase
MSEPEREALDVKRVVHRRPHTAFLGVEVLGFFVNFISYDMLRKGINIYKAFGVRYLDMKH